MIDSFFFFFKQKTAYEMLRSLVGSEMCIRDSSPTELCTPVNNSIAPFAVQMVTFLQEKVLECPSSVGLTMHLMDLFLDELIRSDVPVDLFVYLSEQVPLFVMSKGNFVEKRVLDNFVTPVVSGVLDERRVLTLSLIHISEPTRLLSISYAVFCLKKKKKESIISRRDLIVYT
eukprot:TRINITY_DN5992_c0_g1_i4.p1 TRINITY_DN5992_c0_g1~~TRINITY_DN5992_c0_g1_i4.p1  ORF type:complete len:173 (-),score=68.73 TRINITY_DN5992_c0_g1_i4:25-543(-)